MCSPAFRRGGKKGEEAAPKPGLAHVHPLRVYAPAPGSSRRLREGANGARLQDACARSARAVLCSPPPPSPDAHQDVCRHVFARAQPASRVHRRTHVCWHACLHTGAGGEPRQHTHKRALRRAAPECAACCSISRFMLPFPNQIQALEWEQQQLCTPACPRMRIGCVCSPFSPTPTPPPSPSSCSHSFIQLLLPPSRAPKQEDPYA